MVRFLLVEARGEEGRRIKGRGEGGGAGSDALCHTCYVRFKGRRSGRGGCEVGLIEILPRVIACFLPPSPTTTILPVYVLCMYSCFRCAVGFPRLAFEQRARACVPV